MLRTIIIEGPIGEILGREWKLDVATPAEAMRAIDVLTSGKLFRMLKNQIQTHLGYHLYFDERSAEAEEEYAGPTNAQEIRFEPVLIGAGKNSKGLLQIVIGVVLIVASFFFPTAWAGAAKVVAAAGFSMVLGGIVQLLTPTPKMRESESERSTTIGGVVNTIRQGLPVPLGYGEMIIGSQVISMGITSVSTIGLTSHTSVPQGYIDEYDAYVTQCRALRQKPKPYAEWFWEMYVPLHPEAGN